MKRMVLFFLVLIPFGLLSQEFRLDRIEPPNWWIGFKSPDLQLLIHGKNIATTTVSVDYPGFYIKKINKLKNPNYLFLDMTIGPGTKSGIAIIQFRVKDKIVAKYLYELKDRKEKSAQRQSFSSSDVIYLLMPDRFANGDPANDNVTGMVEKADRNNPDGRHGGDIKGIADHLDYITDLGATTIWITPLLENNQPKYSYHGYSITDYYKIDPRFGTNEEYAGLSKAIHQRGMKLIMDQVFNHCGSGHWWINDLPSPDWINEWPEFTRSNYRAGTACDPYASAIDSDQFVRGWFDTTMPDLNQHNPFVKNYLIQNSIWWVEYAGLDGIRQDTHPYPFKDMMSDWGKRMLEEYPNLNIVGECWMNYPASVAYWQKDALNKDGYNSNLPSVLDFPIYDALNKAFNESESWNTGILRLYDILSLDLSYPNPSNIVVFADNHDVNRYLDSQNDDIRKLKMALAFILTTRGIPEIFYGTEILMTTGSDKGHGFIRRDFPGGWPGDSLNAFSLQGRNENQSDMYNYLHTLLQWRKSKEVVQTGKLKHFIPEHGIYTYFRYNSKETVMVMMNNNDETKTIDTKRYNEFLNKYKTGLDIINGTEIGDLALLTIPSKTALIIELRK
ncbi:MAG: glycoside hydrolase family 13 protein [Bacteroidales bacterium]|jgi:glycosidase|nr:glycoside hydrolase family 13 protein [Bacteroidales bacterium]